MLHEVRTNGLSYLQPGMWHQFTAGQSGTIPNPDVFFRVTSITSGPATATVRLWDLPNGSLRREDSKPKVFLIENGTKRWVTSPAVLAWLGRSWAEVRVPNGALASLPDGADVVLPPTLTISVTPYPLTVNRQVTATVSATDQSTAGPVAGRVIVNGNDVAFLIRDS